VTTNSANTTKTMPRAPNPVIVAGVAAPRRKPRPNRRLLSILVSALSVSACDRPTVERTPEALDHARLARIDPDHGIPIGPILSEIGAEAGEGEIVAVDPVRLTIALRHQQLTPSDWPAMIITFRARRTLVEDAHVGQRVSFRVLARDGVGEIVDLTPAAER